MPDDTKPPPIRVVVPGDYFKRALFEIATRGEPRLECNACGDTPNLYGIIPKDAVAGDQCPCCFIPDMDCDGILVERPTDE